MTSARGLSILLALLLITPVMAVGALSLSGSEGMDLYVHPSTASLRWWSALAADPSWASALLSSLLVATLSTGGALIVAIPTVSAWRLTGSRVLAFGMGLVSLAFLAPAVVTAVGLYAVMTRTGLFDTVPGLAIAHLSVTLPVAVFILRQRLGAADLAAWSIARCLGASPAHALVTWLSACHRPTMLAATAAAFMTSLSEATITLFLTDTRVVTLPRRVVAGLSQDIDPSGYAAMTIWFVAVILATLVARSRPPPTAET